MKKRIIITLIISALLSITLFGCSADSICVHINDAMTESIVNLKAGSTVSQALEEAEIVLGDKDEVSPSPETTLKADDVITISRFVNVTVENGGEAVELSLVGGTVGDAVEKAGITLTDEYAVSYDKEIPLIDGMNIVVTKLISVTLTVDGKTEVIKTSACTVSKFLENQGISLGKKDIVTPSLDKELTKDAKVIVKRVKIKTVKETEVIEFSTVYKTSSSMKQGESKVTQEGKNGEKIVKYRIVYIDGVESERKAIEETITINPIDKIVTQGTKEVTTSGKTIVSKQRVDDCDGSGHGYFVITWSDGSVTYEEY